MQGSPTVVAHLIVGAKPEPYLPAVLDAIIGVCDYAVINDNSGNHHGANLAAIENCAFARAGKLTQLNTTFADFASARNACIDATPDDLRPGWALFVDADEVHGAELAAMSRILGKLPADVDTVDGYSRHFIGSFAWWRAVERRLCFFRLDRGLRWRGAVHERIESPGRRVVLPAVWFHYGYVVEPRVECERGRLYQSLGQRNCGVIDRGLSVATVAAVWGRKLKDAIRFHGRHPLAVQPVIARLEIERCDRFAEVNSLVARQTTTDRTRNALRAANYARLIAWRRVEARMRWNWPGRFAQPAAG